MPVIFRMEHFFANTFGQNDYKHYDKYITAVYVSQTTKCSSSQQKLNSMFLQSDTIQVL